ncbi:lipid-binding SYLF domain-containing protein [Campylobacter sputorum]|uniref:lipid-binding SYLF domain-containing protein n=1 Tax=Campylobacter sputorum TaxID=206 RepID=UPI00053BFE4B|nr:lipid-binding SYLF domain-containing protein [Campylobacter sputorum]
MKKLLLMVVFLVNLLNADIVQNQKVYAVTNLLQDFALDKNISSNDKNMKNVKAIAVIPGLKKGGAVLSFQDGKGIFVMKNHDNTWSSPLFFDYKGTGIGLQLGYQSSDVVMLFYTSRSFKNFFDSQLTLEANADATFVNGVGSGYKNEMGELATYIRSSSDNKGVFIGASIDSAIIRINNQDTNDYYERIYDYEDIINNSPKESVQTKTLKKTLEKYFGTEHNFR